MRPRCVVISLQSHMVCFGQLYGTVLSQPQRLGVRIREVTVCMRFALRWNWWRDDHVWELAKSQGKVCWLIVPWSSITELWDSQTRGTLWNEGGRRVGG